MSRSKRKKREGGNNFCRRNIYRKWTAKEQWDWFDGGGALERLKIRCRRRRITRSMRRRRRIRGEGVEEVKEMKDKGGRWRS